MAVHTVVRHIQLSAHKPFGPRGLPFEHLIPSLDPIQTLGFRSPEGLRVFARPLINGRVRPVGLLAKLLGRRIDAPLFKQSFQSFTLRYTWLCHGSDLPLQRDYQIASSNNATRSGFHRNSLASYSILKNAPPENPVVRLRTPRKKTTPHKNPPRRPPPAGRAAMRACSTPRPPPPAQKKIENFP